MSAMCGVQHRDEKRFQYLMQIIGFNEAMDQLTMVVCVDI